MSTSFPLLEKIAFNVSSAAKGYLGALSGSTVNRVGAVGNRMVKLNRTTPDRRNTIIDALGKAVGNREKARVGTAIVGGAAATVLGSKLLGDKR